MTDLEPKGQDGPIEFEPPLTPDAPESPSGGEALERLNRLLLAAIGFVVLLVAIVLVAVTAVTGAEPSAGAEPPAGAEQKEARSSSKGPSSYTVRKGDSYGSIAQKVGLKVEDLEKFNPYVNPATIRPGQRLKLRATPPKVRKRGPIFHKVRKGDSFGSIAFRWDTSVPRLKRLNPKFEDTPMKPGDNVRLRRK